MAEYRMRNVLTLKRKSIQLGKSLAVRIRTDIVRECRLKPKEEVESYLILEGIVIRPDRREPESAG